MSQPPLDQDWFPTSSLAWRVMREEPTPWARGMFVIQPYGLRIDADGIEALYGGRTKRYGWDEVGDVVRTRPSCRLQLGRETVTVTGYGGRVEALLAEIDRLRPPPPPLAGFNVPAEQIARWLEIEPDEQLTVRLPLWPDWRRLGMPVFIILGQFVLGIYQGHGGWSYVVFWLSILALYSALIMLSVLDRHPRLLVSPYGLRHGRRQIPWDEVMHVLPEAHGWRIRTRRRSFEMRQGPEAERVADTIQRLCAARNQGALLPRMTDIPDHALSRAESAEVSAERGISAAEEGR